MTSEVALLNRSAIALAADSALTITYWNRHKSEFETRYFEGANKIFHLSVAHPVGIMIYAAAELQGAPWDMLIKSYRDSLGKKSHDELAGYARGLFDYIASNTHVYSAAFQEEQFKSDVDSAGARIFGPIKFDEKFDKAPDDAAALAFFNTELTARRADIDAAKFIANAEKTDVDQAIAKYATVMRAQFENDAFYNTALQRVDLAALAEAAIHAVFKVGHTPLRRSGLVIAGFGDKDFFPRLEAYVCYGLVLGKLLWEPQANKSATINQTNGSAIVPFAQDEMINTFVFGMATSGLQKINTELVKALDHFHHEMVAGDLAPDISVDAGKVQVLERLKAQVTNDFGDALVEDLLASHTSPLRQVIGMLAFRELAELAETLILIESLKERVTRPSESVGGPIDVAVISKNDGFIWIKRKHYFDPKLNPRYFATHGMQGT